MCKLDEYMLNVAPCGDKKCFHYLNHIGLLKSRFSFTEGILTALIGAIFITTFFSFFFTLFGVDYYYLWIPAALWGVTGFLNGGTYFINKETGERI